MMNFLVPNFKCALHDLQSFQKEDDICTTIRGSIAPLSNGDEEIVRERLAGAQDWLDDLEATAEGLFNIYHDLVNFRRELTEYKIAHEVALAPHKRLPPEVLSEIFLFATGGVPARFPLGHDEIRECLPQVSSYWRRVALDTTHLWSDIEIWDVNPRQIRMVNRWLQRTRSSSLKFRIYGTNYWEEVFNLLIGPLANRISVLDLLTTAKADHMVQHLALHSKNLSRLRFLSINVGPHSKTKLEFTLDPRLSRISLQLVGASLRTSQIKFPRQNLVSLLLHCDCPADKALELLRDCYSIRDCFVSLQKIDDATLSRLQATKPVVLAHIHKLKVHFCTPEHYAAFLRPLIMPLLRSLLLTGRILTWNDEFISILSNNPFQNLRVLYTGIPKPRIDKAWIPSQHPAMDCVRALHCLPSLQCVHFPPECPITDATLAQIGSGHLLPRLQRFHLHTNNLDGVLRVILQRQLTGTRIESAIISCTKRVQKKHKATLQHLQLEGMDIDVTSSSKLRLEWVMAVFPSLYAAAETYVWNADTES